MRAGYRRARSPLPRMRARPPRPPQRVAPPEPPSRNFPPRKPRARGSRLVGRLVLGLLVLAAVVNLAVGGYHWVEGATPSSAVRMLVDDYRLVVSCPTASERILDFVTRPPPLDGDYQPMSVRHGEDWEKLVCAGGLAYREAPISPSADDASLATPTPAPLPDLQPEVDAAIEDALGSEDGEPSHATQGATAPSATAVATPQVDASAVTPAAATVTATPSPTVSPLTAAPADAPSQRHIELKRFMLELINAERTHAGLEPVGLGVNAAAQLHAEDALAGCFLSHWGADGLKPYMRYTLAGGYQSNAENASGRDYCITPADNYRPIGSIEQEVREAMEGWMQSPGHRDNILRPWHRAVNIGLAWDDYNFVAIQHFEGDYVEYEVIPSLSEEGVLSLRGMVKNGAAFGPERDLGVQVYYDPPPHPLTRGQLARTYCYNNGLLVAALRPPVGLRSYYLEDAFEAAHSPCPNPYDVPDDALAPRSPDEAHVFWQAAYDATQSAPEHPLTVPWITAWEMRGKGSVFSVRADLSEVLARHGPGVYTLIVWGTIGGDPVVISEYSIFHKTDPPGAYERTGELLPPEPLSRRGEGGIARSW